MQRPGVQYHLDISPVGPKETKMSHCIAPSRGLAALSASSACTLAWRVQGYSLSPLYVDMSIVLPEHRPTRRKQRHSCSLCTSSCHGLAASVDSCIVTPAWQVKGYCLLRLNVDTLTLHGSPSGNKDTAALHFLLWISDSRNTSC